MSQSAPVLFEELPTESGHRLGVARLNAEKSLNALTLEMIDLLAERCAAWSADDGIALVVLEGAGERAFCAGADLTRLHGACLAHHASASHDDIRANAYALDFFSREYRLDYALHTFPKPVLCWGHGVVMGGGMGLMIGASHRVVTEQVRIAMPEINIGLYADVAGSWFLARAPGRTGLFLALTAAQLGASDALFAGLADYHVEHARKAEVLARLQAQPWRGASRADGAALSRILDDLAAPAAAPGPLRRHFDLINRLCAPTDPREIIAAVAALESSDEWLARAAATLRAGSPTTAVLSIELQRRLKICSLAEVFRAELVASLACAARPDLAEGIRALIIDKDRKPHWQPATVEAVTDAWIDGFFASPWSPQAHPLADL
ncbi:MAG: enoyl-CoA hydratase/isomerase family protein [Gammaproteobacteria bacterium]|nr:enoyl-CoA hydratase/isomerase family protein [Gammaproteobacteria bacterium]